MLIYACKTIAAPRMRSAVLSGRSPGFPGAVAFPSPQAGTVAWIDSPRFLILQNRLGDYSGRTAPDSHRNSLAPENT